MANKSAVTGIVDSYLVNEQKTKLKDLFKFFCNHVFLGQWELAKSAIPKLIKELRHSDVNVDFIEMLIDISEFPFSQSLGSITVPTPHHLSWLCLSELKKIPESLDPKLKTGIDRLIKDVDFRLTLAQLKDADTKVIQELYVYFKRNILKVRTPSLDEDRERGDFLSKATMKELKRTMLTSPALCDSIIRALMPENAKAESRDCEMLQGIYIDCLNSLLDNVEAGISLGLLESELEQLTSHMLLILASHDPLPYWNYLQLRQLFTRLLRLCLNQEGLSLLTIEEVVSVLYRRKTTYLLDEVCKIYHEVCVLSTVKNEESYSDFLTDDHRVNLLLLKKIDRNECWRDFFITCQKRQSHFLGEILDLSLSLIRAGKFMALQDLLSFPELLPLRAPVLLIGWSQCGTFSQVRTLLDTLWDDSAENLNVVLKSTCRKLVYHLDLIQWCLERVKSGTEGPETSGSFAIDMLRDLETHSVLHILQRFTNLASLDHAEILQLLMNLPDKKEEKKQKTVTFKDQSKQKDQPEAINVEQQRDIAIFRSYCALKNVMDALLFSADNSDHELMNPVKVKRTVKAKSLQRNFMMEQSLSSSEGDDSSSPGLNMESKSEGDTAEKCHGDSDQFLQSYENMVTKKLKEAKEHLSHIQPLTFRLEILENIFSLLFVTHEDLLEHVSGTSEPDSGDENDDSKRSSSVDIAHDSLNMSLVSEDETVGDDSLFEKAKSLSPAPSSPLVPSPQPASSGVDYDEPFVDPLEKTKSLSPVAETNQSSYFTLDSKLQKKVVEETSKQKLRDEIKTLTKKVKRKRKRESLSEQSSYPQGFLGNEYLVRDILHLLKDAAADLNAAKFSLSGKVVDMIRRDSTKYSPVKLDPELEKVLQSSSITTIQPETLQKRITKLMQAVHEAWWRFQLVSHEAFPKQPGRILVEKITVTDDDINFLPLCDRKVFSSDIEERSGIESECVNSPNRRLSSVGTLTPPSNIVTKMTAPPERLLILTLIKNNHQQAAEVIKLFRLTEKTAETCEVAFADIYKNRSAEIWDLETERREATPVPQRVGKRSVKALSRAAAIGVASASLSHITEDLLAASCLPPIPRPKTAYARENFGYLFNLDTPSAVLIDLLCTSCRTWDTCSNMMDIIKTRSSKLLEHDPRRTSAMTSLSSSSQSDTWSTHQNELSSPSSSVSSPPSISHGHGKPKHLKPSLRSIVGCTEFVWQLHDLVHLEDTSSSSFHVGARPLQLPRLSLQQRLNSGHMSLQADGIRSIEMATVELRRAMDRLLTVLSGTGPGRQLDISIEDPQPSPAPSPSTRGSSPGSFSGSTSSNVTPSLKNQPKQEQNLLHVAFKSLMCAMEKYIPGEGFAQLMNGKAFKVMSPPLKNYLLSLYEHVREMAYLVSECEGKNKDLLGNYFKVLDEGPVDVLGRLLFVKKMPPARLEAVAEKLSLNLTHTIVYSCCPRIPSKHAAVTAAELDECCKLWGSTVANVSAGDKDSLSSTTADSTLTGEKPRHPELVVREMLVQVVKMMKKYAKTHSAHGVFDIACAKNLVREQDYLAAVKMTSRLRSLDLNMLTSGDERICFFANLANLMVIHCHLAKILSRLELLLKQEEKGGNGDEEQIELFPLAAADNLMYLSSFSFSVGQLGVVSAFDILNVLCRSGLAAASQWRDLLGCRTLKLDPQDSWGQHAPPPESRLIFVLNSGCISSPPLVVLNPDHVQTQLEMAMKDYLSHTVRVSVDQERVCLPQLLMWHEHDFVADKELVVDTRHSALVKWMTPYLSAETQNRLEQLFLLDSVHGFSENIDVSGKNELPFRVETDPFDNTFSFTFGVTHVKVGSPSTMPSVVAPVSKKTKAPAALFSNSLEAAGMGQSLQLPKYNLTPVTLEYVKHDSLLAATMVSLVCADNLDNIEQQFTDDHFNVPELTPAQQHLEGLPRPHRSSSDISLVDIRSYRYQRLTNDYPVLQRHLLQYILPLAGADHPELLESREPILKFVTNDIEDQVKLCMFSLADSEQFQGVIHDMANRLLEERKWMELLTMLGSLPSSVISEFSPLQVLHDFSLSCWAISHVKLPGQAPKVGDRLRWFYNPTLQARIVLTVTYSLPLDLASDLLDLCIHGLEESSGLWQAVVSRKKEIGIHSKIMASVKRLHIKLSTQDASVLALNDSEQQLLAVVEELRDWRSIPKVSADRPADILLVLEQTKEFDVAAEWAEMNKLAPDTIQEIKKRHLTSLLSGSQPDTVTAFQVLDELHQSSETECLVVCQALANQLSRPNEIKFVLSFILRYLSQHLLPDDVEDLRLRRIGAKALMCIPAKIQDEYSHLLACPHLILEQLLMNMKAELAGQIFEQIKPDFVEVREPKLRMAQEQFNALLTTYARKAVEVTVVQVQEYKSRSESAASSGSGHLEESEMLTSTMRRSYDKRRVSPTLSLASTQSARPDATGRVGMRQKSASATSANTGSRFVMPAQPPTQDQWVPDDATAVCMVCTVERFSMFNRRHHCRRCGRVVCAACSTKQTIVFGVPGRTCDECFEQLHASSEHRAQEEHEIYSQRIKERLSGAGSGATPTSPGMFASSPTPLDLPGLLSADLLKKNMTAAIQHVHHSWKLRPDTAFSDQVRSEFYFEQAPSVSLCISILKQHSSRLEAGKLTISLCDTLSSHLQPISPGVPNPEIDYSLIISVMKQLLFQAKLDFLSSSSTGMSEQCELYLARVDLLRVMVEANYQDLPTVRELTKQDTVRRLRDKLIADERLKLAMEVSTKCGIDPAGVWAAMGFARLHLGDYQGAREKFGHCLKVPTDKNKPWPSQSRLLGEIIDFLDTIPSSGLTEVEKLLRDPSNICDIKTLLVPSVGEENRVESVPYQECLFYLRTYGSFMDHISFLRQHSYWMKAVQFASDRHCSADVFVTGLVVPAMSSGEMGRLLEQMLMLDPTLEKWLVYLTATCKHLLRQKYFHSLYQVQLFMKDYIRASMTCVSYFYQRGARTYLDLCGRLQFLFTAQQHLQAYLDPSQWGSVRHPLAPVTPVQGSSRQQLSWDKSSADTAARMTLSTDEVKKHIRIIALQIEVTKFLEQCITQSLGSVDGSGPRAGSQQLPTLFGSNTAKTELVSLVILSGQKLSTGFELGVRIVKEFRLDPTHIFTHCSRELAKQGRFSDINVLIQNLLLQGMVTDETIDEIVGASLLVIANSHTHSQAKDESDTLIQLLRNDSNKINALILCGKLRSAYLLAVKRERVEDVQRIAGAAQRLGQSAVTNICRKWLEQHHVSQKKL